MVPPHTHFATSINDRATMVHLSPTKFASNNDREKGDTFLTNFLGVQQRPQVGDTSPPFWGKSNNDE